MGVVGPATKPHDFTECPFLIHFVHLQDEMGEVDEELLMAKMFNFNCSKNPSIITISIILAFLWRYFSLKVT